MEEGARRGECLLACWKSMNERCYEMTECLVLEGQKPLNDGLFSSLYLWLCAA